MATAIELEGVSVFREAEDGSKRPVIEKLTLSLAAGARLALVGKNGAGKTSLLLALVGALDFEGRIRIGETLLGRRTQEAIRRRVGFVFADPSDQLFCASVADEVAFGPRQLALPEAEVRARVERAIAAVGLGGYESRVPAALSLGEQRRLAIAAALAMQPELLLIDEPTAALDPVARRELIAILRQQGITLVLASHDLDAVLDLDARTLILDAGHVVADGPAPQILHDERLLARAGLALPLAVAARRN